MREKIKDKGTGGGGGDKGTNRKQVFYLSCAIVSPAPRTLNLRKFMFLSIV